MDPILGADESSTNANTHTTDVVDRLDPIVEFDTDCPNTKEGPTNHEPHSTNVGDRPILRIDSDIDRRSQNANVQTRRSGTFLRRGTDPLIKPSNVFEEARTGHDPGSDDELDRHARRVSLAKDDPIPLDEPRLAASPYNGGFLVLLDPKIDRNGAKQIRSSGS